MSQGRDSALRNKLNYGFAEVVLYAEFAKIVPVKNRKDCRSENPIFRSVWNYFVFRHFNNFISLKLNIEVRFWMW